MRTFPSEGTNRENGLSWFQHTSGQQRAVSTGGHYGKWLPRLQVNSNLARRPGADLSVEACRLCQICPFADRVFAKFSGPLGVVRSLARFCLARLAPLGTASEIFGELMSQGNWERYPVVPPISTALFPGEPAAIGYIAVLKCRRRTRLSC